MNWESAVLDLLTASLVRPFLLVAAAALVLRFLRVEHPASKHAVWSVVLVGILVLPFAAVFAPHLEFAVLPESVLFSLTRSQPIDEDRPEVNHANEKASASGAAMGAGATSAGPTLPADVAASTAGPARRSGWQARSAYTFVVWIYLSGLGIVVAYRVMGWLLLWRVRSRSQPQAHRWLRESPDVLVPIAVGVLRPTVLLPSGWRNWPADARRAALTHEFAHIRRRDAWVQALSRTARCLYWFHPLVWWVSRKVSEFAEMSCDAAVLQRGVDPFRYSRVLVDFSDVVRRNGCRATLPGLAIMGRSWLSRRIDHVIAMSSTKPRRLAKPVATLVLVGMPLMAASATLQLTERGGLRVLPIAVEQGAAAVISSTLESIVSVAANFNPVPLISQALPSDNLVASQTAFATRAFLNGYCVSCHNNTNRVAGLSIEALDLTNLRTNADVWEKVILKLRSGVHIDSLPNFPPAPRPGSAEVLGAVQWLEDGLDRMPPNQASPTSRPLNRTEYANAIRDVLGLEINVALLLPPDDSSFGFDNIASALEAQRSTLSQEIWTFAAEKISGLALSTPVSRNQIFTCRPATASEEDGCASTLLAALAGRAYRGKETPDDVSRLLDIYRASRTHVNYTLSFDTGIRAAIQAVLANRKFLYRDEASPETLGPGQSYPVDDIDLASRLSFFLWSTGPDTRLLDLAKQGRLNDPAVLESEARRMLQDPRSEALAINFAGQWLNLRQLESIGPLPLFKDFDEALRLAMRREAEMFFNSIVREDRNVLDLLNADYTFVNDRLARHYGMLNVAGDQFRRVVLGPEFDSRRGLLGKAAILTVTSTPTRTSIVSRAKWVLRNVMGVFPPDPPPNVPPLPEKISGRASDPTGRELLAQHNFDERCRGCHRLMDPIGITLENFDAIGKWRTEDEGKRIDTAVDFLDGTRLNGPGDLRSVLNSRSELFVRTLTQKLLTYALGRGATYQDMPAVRAIAREAAANNNRFSSIVLGVVKSPAFQMNVKR